MRGTFKPGDKLVIERIPFKQIKKGDLIIFNRTFKENSDFIIHRVADIAKNGLITRGDNCLGNDRGFVNENDIMGRVIEYDRWGKIRKVQNRRIGTLRAALLHGRLHFFKFAKSISRKPFLIIKKSGLIAKIWQPEIEIFRFETPDGPLVKFVHRGRTVAICLTEKNQWRLKLPYKFILKSD